MLLVTKFLHATDDDKRLSWIGMSRNRNSKEVLNIAGVLNRTNAVCRHLGKIVSVRSYPCLRSCSNVKTSLNVKCHRSRPLGTVTFHDYGFIRSTGPSRWPFWSRQRPTSPQIVKSIDTQFFDSPLIFFSNLPSFCAALKDKSNSASCENSGFRRGIIEICALLGFYAARIGSSLAAFRDNLTVPPTSLDCEATQNSGDPNKDLPVWAVKPLQHNGNYTHHLL
jgi:hypothetical protein